MYLFNNDGCRHQTKNRKHLNFLLDLANGNRVLNIANTMAVAANIPVTGSSAKSPGAPSTPLPGASGSSASGVIFQSLLQMNFAD